MGRVDSGGRSGWSRVIGLMVVTGVMSIMNPAILVAIPLGLLALFLPPRGRTSILVAALAGFLAFVGTPGSGLWYLERGWALVLGGTFLAVTLRWPERGFLSRGLGAVGGSFAAMGLLFWTRPGQWAVVDWSVTSRMEEGVALVFQAVRASIGPDAISVGVEARMLEAMALQGVIFPALLGLASLAALGVAWWLYLRLGRSPEIGLEPLGQFRFNDQWVWVLILGFVLLMGSSGLLERVGTNTIVFMGGLYVLRGVAAALVLLGGPSVVLGIVFFLLFLVAAPFFVTGAFVFGLGDTWLNFRARWGPQVPQ